VQVLRVNVRKSARDCGIWLSSRKKPCQMSFDPTDTRRQDPAGASVISFTERRASRDAAQALPAAPVPGQATRARVAAVTDICWCCRSKVRAVVGVIVEPALTDDGTGFLPLDKVDTALVGALDSRTLARRGIGALRHRESPGVEGGYIANGCIECDALIGRFHLEDLLADHRNAGSSLGQLDIGIAVELDLVPGEQRTARSALG
jgi:hypothetical protein